MARCYAGRLGGGGGRVRWLAAEAGDAQGDLGGGSAGFTQDRFAEADEYGAGQLSPDGDGGASAGVGAGGGRVEVDDQDVGNVGVAVYGWSPLLKGDSGGGHGGAGSTDHGGVF